ncbi:MAG: endonuclease [Candidatus Hydrogenedens sp.]|nr:endonuclease [Candidatus Hydrogenedens sp.]
MTFNVRYGTANDGENAWPKRRELLVETIKEQDPDVLGVQECLPFQAEYIQENLRGYRWLGIGREFNGDGEMTAVFYRERALVPIESGNFWLSEKPDQPGSKSWDSSLPRIATWARFHHPESGRFLYYVNTHFDHRGEEAREESAKLIAKRVADIAGPVIITGDFNAIAEDSAPWKALIDSGLYDSWVSAAKKTGPDNTWSGFTGPSPDRQRRIDWILFKGPLDCAEAEIITKNDNGRYPSDHLPVVSKFVWHAGE